MWADPVRAKEHQHPRWQLARELVDRVQVSTDALKRPWNGKSIRSEIPLSNQGSTSIESQASPHRPADPDAGTTTGSAPPGPDREAIRGPNVNPLN